MTSFKLNFMVFVVVMVTTTQFYEAAAQTTHVVGGALGWTIPPVGPFAYAFWTTFRTFTVGDTLVFNFTTGQHTVAEVSQEAYYSCNTTNPVSLKTTGPTTFGLITPGKHYYICTVLTHCQIGQKLAINVVATTSTATPPVAATPPSTGPISSTIT